MRSSLVFFGGLALTLTCTRAVADTCPLSCVFSFCSTASQRDTTITDSRSGASGSASYNLVTGQLSIQFDSGFDGCGVPSATARDRFTLVGPSSPEPVPFAVSLYLYGQAYSQLESSTIRGTLGDGIHAPASAEATAYGGYVPFASLSQSLSLQLLHPVGEPFDLIYTASGTGCGFSRGSLSASLIFFNLPPGYVVTSCQGYSTPGVVPVLKPTWGQVKLQYR